MADDAIAVLTGKSVSTLVSDGGSGSWLLSQQKAMRRRYLVCVRNADNADPQSGEAHRSAFLVGVISGIASLGPLRGSERWRILFDKYAMVDVPEVWRGWRNPVRYTSLAELGIDPDALTFRSASQGDVGVDPAPHHKTAVSGAPGLSIAEAKAGLAIRFGVSVEAIEITIRG